MRYFLKVMLALDMNYNISEVDQKKNIETIYVTKSVKQPKGNLKF